ncbi:MAG: ATP-dependent Clp protease adaptor ClpS [Phycisphaerales bacterium]
MTPKPRPARPIPEPLPPWRVLLHNDDVNDADYVVAVLERVARLLRPAATRCMMAAHTRGVGTVLTTHRERAELLAEQFASCGLTVTIEPM